MRNAIQLRDLALRRVRGEQLEKWGQVRGGNLTSPWGPSESWRRPRRRPPRRRRRASATSSRRSRPVLVLWSDSPVQVGLLMDSRCEVRFGVTATARDRPRVRCFARDGTQIPSSRWDSGPRCWDTVSWAARFQNCSLSFREKNCSLAITIFFYRLAITN